MAIVARPISKTTMEAVRVHPNPDSSKPYSPSNPAPASALVLDTNLPIPQAGPGELLVRVKATTVIKDCLTWPETYASDYTVPGNDFAGTVVAVGAAESSFKPGDEVYGMTDAARPGTWAAYVVVKEEEACLKPKSLTWEQAAAVPLSALTAYQALFDHAGIAVPDFGKVHASHKLEKNDDKQRLSILITGASGGVGIYLVQLAKLAGLHVVAATRSTSRTGTILQRLGADEVVEYEDLFSSQREFHIIIDAIGGSILEACWSHIEEAGTLVSVESSSYNFVEQHRQQPNLTSGRDRVKALFFIVTPSSQHLKHLSAALDAKELESFVASVMPLEAARSAYELADSGTSSGWGKIVLTPRHNRESAS